MTETRQHACNYAVLRFLPYPETGEFVNLGIVAHCPALRMLEVATERKKFKRVFDFFPELDRNAFRAARKAVQADLERVQALVGNTPDVQLAQRIFRELVRPREAVFRFGEIRTILTPEPQQVAAVLFEQYVNRQFAQEREYHEVVMARRYLQVLRKHPTGRHFRAAVVGTESYHVRVPIVSTELALNQAPQRAIKPLDLEREEPTAVIEHGDAWIQRLKRLREFGRMPERFIFAVRRPTAGACADAAAKVVTELKEAGGKVIDAEDTAALVDLAGD